MKYKRFNLLIILSMITLFAQGCNNKPQNNVIEGQEIVEAESKEKISVDSTGDLLIMENNMDSHKAIKKKTLDDTIKPARTLAKQKKEAITVDPGQEINDEDPKEDIFEEDGTQKEDNNKKAQTEKEPFFNMVSHEIWDELLKKHVSSDGKVDYAGLSSKVKRLEEYIAELKLKTPKSDWKENEKLAYWINAYNAFTVKLILDNYPLKSIMEINSGKAWDLKFIELDHKKLSLNDIEHSIIRERFKEPRIHFAVNCAAKSCPKLLNQAYLPENLDKQLSNQTRYFLKNKGKNVIQANQLQLSKIFEWYADDFGGVTEFVNRYTDIAIDPGAKVTYLDYDWALNN